MKMMVPNVHVLLEECADLRNLSGSRKSWAIGDRLEEMVSGLSRWLRLLSPERSKK